MLCVIHLTNRCTPNSKDMNKQTIKNCVVMFIAVVLSITSYAQNGSVAEILKNKDFGSVSVLMADELDLCIMDDTQINSKDEALKRIKRFIASNPIDQYETLHIGQADGLGSKYNVYKLVMNDKVIRAFVYFEEENNKSYIKELRFDKF